MRRSESENTSCYLIVTSVALLLPFLLYKFRIWDDNRLTSWQWTFTERTLMWFPALLVVGIAVAFILSRFPAPRSRTLYLFGLSFLAAALFWGEPEVIVDASRYFTQAKQLAVNGPGYFFSEWGKEIFAWTDLPLMPFLYGLVFRFFGESRICIQILLTLIYCATVLMTYSLGKLLWDDEAGFLGALLLLGFPYLYTQIPLLLVDVPTMFFLLLAVLMFILSLRRGGAIKPIMAGIAIFLAFYVKFSAWVFLACLGIVFLIHLPSSPRATMRRGGAVAVWAALFIGILFYLRHEVFLSQIRFLLDYQKAGLGRWGEGYLSTFLFQTHGFISAAVLFSVFVAVRKRDLAFGNIACFVVLIFVLNLHRARYTLPLFPFIALMASYGIREIGDIGLRRYIVYGAVNTSLIIALAVFLPFLKDMSAANIKEAGEFLNGLGVDNVEVLPLASRDAVINPEVNIPLLDYYASSNIDYVDVLPRPALDEYRTSPLRFTWEYRPPDIYLVPMDSKSKNEAVVVVSCQPVPPLPEAVLKKVMHFRQKKTFARNTGVFLDRTVVSVYFN